MAPEHSPDAFGGHVITGGCGSSTVIVCTHCPVLLHEAAIVYVLVIVGGHVPLSVCSTLNVVADKAQLSDALPAPIVKAESVVSAGGTDPIHSKVKFAGHDITGGVWSSMVIVCTHCPVFPQESAIVKVLVIILGHVPFEL